MRVLSSDIRDANLCGLAHIPAMVEDAVRDAGLAADAWPTREQRRHFLIELAAEARSEWMEQAEPNGPAAQFYDALKQRLTEMSRA
jgi:hypothetical protein